MNITTKDYFAAHALQALLIAHPDWNVDDIVIFAHTIAEKMTNNKDLKKVVNNFQSSKQIRMDNVENL